MKEVEEIDQIPSYFGIYQQTPSRRPISNEQKKNSQYF